MKLFGRGDKSEAAAAPAAVMMEQTDAAAAKSRDGDGDAGAADAGSSGAALAAADRKATLAIAPLFAATVAISAIDRNNVAFASISLLPALKLTPSQYGLATSLFYATYILGLIPAGLLAPHVGARRMLAALLVAWGAVASCMALAKNAPTLYVLRLLLGACESGALPAMWHHLARFYSRARITKPFGYLYLGVALSGIIGAPLAAGLLALDGRGGLAGWQWLFVLEGAPAALLGILMWLLLPDTPSDVRGLASTELAALEHDLAREAADDEERRRTPGWRLVLMVLNSRYTPLMALINFVCGFVSSVFVFWAPLIVQGLLTGTALTRDAAKGASARGSLPAVGLSTVPYVVGAVTVLLAAAHAQRRRELFLHGAAPLFIGGVITACFPLLARLHPAAGFVALCATLACSLAANPSVTSILSLMNKGPQQSAALPVFDSFMHVGAVIGSPAAGAIVQRTGGGFTFVTVLMGALICAAAILIVVLGVWVAHGPRAEQVLLRRRRRGRVVDDGDDGGDCNGGGDNAAADKPQPAPVEVIV